jgi:hypothetical protein
LFCIGIGIEVGLWALLCAVFMLLPWQAGDTRFAWTEALRIPLALIWSLVPLAVLCFLLWSDLAHRDAEPSNAAAAWRKRWIWMLSGYFVLNIAVRSIGAVQMFAAAWALTLSESFVRVAAIAAYALMIFAAVVLARWWTRKASARETAAWQRASPTPRGIAKLALLGIAAQSAVLLGARELSRIGPIGAPNYFTGTFGWMVWSLQAVVPLAALCCLLWADRRRTPDQVRITQAEA